MSLINDVLRQVDSNAKSNLGIESILPAVTMHTNEHRNIFTFVFYSVLSALLLILIFQLVSDKPLFSMFKENHSDVADSSYQNSSFVPELQIKDTSILPLNLVVVDAVNNKTDPDDALINKSHEDAQTADVPATDVQESTVELPVLITSSHPKPAFSEGAMPSDSDVAGKSSVENDKPVEKAISILPKPAIEGEMEYQSALKFFIEGNIPAADQLIKKALKVNKLEKYNLLQARVFIKQKDSDGFYKLVRDNSKNDSLDWFKLIAPGLQLFSYHKLSNKYYQSLVLVEPDQMRWKLAIALNYQRLDEPQEAILTYQQLYRSDQVSNQQRQWLLKRIEQLSAKKG